VGGVDAGPQREGLRRLKAAGERGGKIRGAVVVPRAGREWKDLAKAEEPRTGSLAFLNAATRAPCSTAGGGTVCRH